LFGHITGLNRIRLLRRILELQFIGCRPMGCPRTRNLKRASSDERAGGNIFWLLLKMTVVKTAAK
jgi:hypothetical protein